jgi:hypothetical protein
MMAAPDEQLKPTTEVPLEPTLPICGVPHDFWEPAG